MDLFKWFAKMRKLLKNEEFRIKLFTLLIINSLVGLLIISIIIGNKEFIYYDAILLPAVLLAYFVHKRLRLHLPILVSIWILFLMHAVGGVARFNGIRLYDITFGFLRYDMIVHFFGIFIVVFVAYNLIYGYFREKKKYSNFYLFFILVFMAMGFGVLIELVEFFAVIFLGAASGVGDYFNNATDLFVNTLGAILGAILVTNYHNKKFFKNLLFKGKLK